MKNPAERLMYIDSQFQPENQLRAGAWERTIDKLQSKSDFSW